MSEMPELSLELRKTIALIEICRQIDSLYHYAIELIGKGKVHNLGFRKEMVKDFIEQKIKNL